MSTYFWRYFVAESPDDSVFVGSPDLSSLKMSTSSHTNSELTFCPGNQSLNQVWVEDGFSHCFFETVVDAVTLAITLFFGVIQIWFYRKYSTQVKHYELPYSQLFGLQMILNGLMPLVSLSHFILEISTSDTTIYGYTILSLLEGFIVWPMLCTLVMQERNNMLPAVPRKGHGLILLLIWTWVFAAQNLILVNFLSPAWFFSFASTADIFRFILFLLEYGMSCGILVIGVKAPGIPSFQNSDRFTRLISNEYVSYSALRKNPPADTPGNGATTDSTSGEDEPHKSSLPPRGGGQVLAGISEKVAVASTSPR